MSQKDRLNHFIEAGRIRYIVERFGFNEKEIILLPNSSDDHERIIRFKVMGNIFCIKNGALFLEKQG